MKIKHAALMAGIVSALLLAACQRTPEPKTADAAPPQALLRA